MLDEYGNELLDIGEFGGHDLVRVREVSDVRFVPALDVVRSVHARDKKYARTVWEGTLTAITKAQLREQVDAKVAWLDGVVSFKSKHDNVVKEVVVVVPDGVKLLADTLRERYAYKGGAPSTQAVKRLREDVDTEHAAYQGIVKAAIEWARSDPAIELRNTATERARASMIDMEKRLAAVQAEVVEMQTRRATLDAEVASREARVRDLRTEIAELETHKLAFLDEFSASFARLWKQWRQLLDQRASWLRDRAQWLADMFSALQKPQVKVSELPLCAQQAWAMWNLQEQEQRREQRAAAKQCVENVRAWRAAESFKAQQDPVAFVRQLLAQQKVFGTLYTLQLAREQLAMVQIEQSDLVEDNEANARAFHKRLVEALPSSPLRDALERFDLRFIDSRGRWQPGCTIVKEVCLFAEKTCCTVQRTVKEPKAYSRTASTISRRRSDQLVGLGFVSLMRLIILSTCSTVILCSSSSSFPHIITTKKFRP